MSLQEFGLLLVLCTAISGLDLNTFDSLDLTSRDERREIRNMFIELRNYKNKNY
jgi:hypothetical protein